MLTLDQSPTSADLQKSPTIIVLSPDAQIPCAANTYVRRRREREEKAMGIRDFEVQRERRAELLR